MTDQGNERPSAAIRRATAAHRVRGVEESPELRHTLEHIGELMRLPPKEPGAESASAPTPAKAPAKAGFSIQVPWLPILAGLSIVIAAVVTLWPTEPTAVPEAMQREWVTDNPSFTGRRLAFTATQVLITPGADQQSTAYLISSVTSERRPDTTRVLVKYIDNGGEVELQVAMPDAAPPRLVFARPQGLTWTPSNP
ncbi:MAG: hypothetical protein OEW77_11535 [Gemmatimonadota bacterium]|nr:hypothetical protein [Gemmatimonadota bacterium]